MKLFLQAEEPFAVRADGNFLGNFYGCAAVEAAPSFIEVLPHSGKEPVCFFADYRLISHENAEKSMDAAACVGCGACVATCKNGSAMLFVGARVSSLALLPQGRPEAERRARAMVAKMDELGFGNCTNTRACEMECPKGISVDHIARLNREFLKSKFRQ